MEGLVLGALIGATSVVVWRGIAQVVQMPRAEVKALAMALSYLWVRGRHAAATDVGLALVESDPRHCMLETVFDWAVNHGYRLSEVASAYERCLTVRPRNVGNRYNLGVAFAELGQVDAAREQWTIVVGEDNGGWRDRARERLRGTVADVL